MQLLKNSGKRKKISLFFRSSSKIYSCLHSIICILSIICLFWSSKKLVLWISCWWLSIKAFNMYSTSKKDLFLSEFFVLAILWLLEIKSLMIFERLPIFISKACVWSLIYFNFPPISLSKVFISFNILFSFSKFGSSLISVFASVLSSSSLP